MNRIDRIIACTRFEPLDQIPVIAQVFGHAATLTGQELASYVQDGAVLASCQEKAQKYYQNDAVFASMGATVEAEAMGGKIEHRPGIYPFLTHFPFTRDVDPSTIAAPDPQVAGRMPEILKALAILRRRLGDELLVVGMVLGPFTLLTQLMGMEEALYFSLDQPSILARVLDKLVLAQVAYGRAQLQAGAHLIMIFDPSASEAVVPPPFFYRHLLPHLQTLATALKAAGSIATWLHIAGPVERILPLYPQIGADIGNFDYCISPDQVVRAVSHTCVNGNIAPAHFITSTPAAIRAESETLATFFKERGGFILSSGCEIPPEARPELVQAMMIATRR